MDSKVEFAQNVFKEERERNEGINREKICSYPRPRAWGRSILGFPRAHEFLSASSLRGWNGPKNGAHAPTYWEV